jgi:hypothetical protein
MRTSVDSTVFSESPTFPQVNSKKSLSVDGKQSIQVRSPTISESEDTDIEILDSSHKRPISFRDDTPMPPEIILETNKYLKGLNSRDMYLDARSLANRKLSQRSTITRREKAFITFSEVGDLTEVLEMIWGDPKISFKRGNSRVIL